MRPPMNMTPEETEIWQRMEQYGEELVGTWVRLCCRPTGCRSG